MAVTRILAYLFPPPTRREMAQIGPYRVVYERGGGTFDPVWTLIYRLGVLVRKSRWETHPEAIRWCQDRCNDEALGRGYPPPL